MVFSKKSNSEEVGDEGKEDGEEEAEDQHRWSELLVACNGI